MMGKKNLHGLAAEPYMPYLRKDVFVPYNPPNSPTFPGPGWHKGPAVYSKVPPYYNTNEGREMRNFMGMGEGPFRRVGGVTGVRYDAGERDYVSTDARKGGSEPANKRLAHRRGRIDHSATEERGEMVVPPSRATAYGRIGDVPFNKVVGPVRAPNAAFYRAGPGSAGAAYIGPAPYIPNNLPGPIWPGAGWHVGPSVAVKRQSFRPYEDEEGDDLDFAGDDSDEKKMGLMEYVGLAGGVAVIAFLTYKGAEILGGR
jgi:hypothetical protein